MDDAWAYVVMGVCAAVTYLWRGLGVALSSRIHPQGRIFDWIGCIAYALLASFMARIIVLPVGILAATALSHRLAATFLAVAAFYIAKRNIFLGLFTGIAALVLLTLAGQLAA